MVGTVVVDLLKNTRTIATIIMVNNSNFVAVISSSSYSNSTSLARHSGDNVVAMMDEVQ